MHSHGRPRRFQVGRPARVEPLEGRSLLSALVPPSTAAQADEQVAIQVPSAYISDRVGTLDVTLQRSAQPGGPGATAAAQAQALLEQPLTVELSIVQGRAVDRRLRPDQWAGPRESPGRVGPRQADARCPAGVREVASGRQLASARCSDAGVCAIRDVPGGDRQCDRPGPAGPTRESDR